MEEIRIEGFDVLIKNDGTLFSVSVKELPGCVSQGNTREEAIKNIGKAIRLYLTTLAREQFKPKERKKAKIAEPLKRSRTRKAKR